MFGSQKDEARGEWRKLHNVELNDVACSAYGGKESLMQVFCGKT